MTKVIHETAGSAIESVSDSRLARSDIALRYSADVGLLSAASHDLRQPLHAMRLLLAAFPQAGLSEPGRNILANLDEAVETLGRQLGDLLDIARLESGVVNPSVAGFPAEQVLARLEDAAAELTGLCRIVYSRTKVESDPDLLAVVLRNFLSNALRHGSGRPVLVGCRRQGPILRFEVWDRGPGIEERDLTSVFDPFYQVGAPQRSKSRGLGLGLTVARRIAELLGHRIDVVSYPGKATGFAVSVPIVD